MKSQRFSILVIASALSQYPCPHPILDICINIIIDSPLGISSSGLSYTLKQIKDPPKHHICKDTPNINDICQLPGKIVFELFLLALEVPGVFGVYQLVEQL